jgi:molybdate transport system substrate-binding protein
MGRRPELVPPPTLTSAIAALAPTHQGGPAQSAEIRVFSSAAPRGVFRELSPEFERATGHRLVVSYEFAADLKRRIEAGDPFDVAILPPDLADDLMRRGKLAAASRVDLGHTGMGVAVRRGAPKPDIGTLDEFRRVLVAAPTVAYANGGATGVHVRNILARLGIAEAMKQKLRPYPSGGAVEAVARGEVDLVIIGALLSSMCPVSSLSACYPRNCRATSPSPPALAQWQVKSMAQGPF